MSGQGDMEFSMSSMRENMVERPKWKGGTGHMFFTNASSGYEREGMRASDRTKQTFTQNKFVLERSRDPVLGENEKDVKGHFLVRMPKEKPMTVTHAAEDMMSNATLNEPDNSQERVSSLESRIRVDQLKHRRDIIAKQLRDLNFHMSAGRAGYESNALEVGTRDLLLDSSGKHHSLGRSLKPTTTTEDIGGTTAEDYNYFNGTGTPGPDLPNRGLKSTLHHFPRLRSKSQLPRIPGVGFA